MSQSCFQCGEQGAEIFGYTLCDSCTSRLGLFTEETVRKHVEEYDGTHHYSSYAEEVEDKLKLLENDYYKKRIKLLDIQKKIKNI